MEKRKSNKWRNGKFKEIARDDTLGFQLGIWENPDGINLFSLNQLFQHKKVGSLTLNKKQLKNLKRFMGERKIK